MPEDLQPNELLPARKDDPRVPIVRPTSRGRGGRGRGGRGGRSFYYPPRGGRGRKRVAGWDAGTETTSFTPPQPQPPSSSSSALPHEPAIWVFAAPNGSKRQRIDSSAAVSSSSSAPPLRARGDCRGRGRGRGRASVGDVARPGASVASTSAISSSAPIPASVSRVLSPPQPPVSQNGSQSVHDVLNDSVVRQRTAAASARPFHVNHARTGTSHRAPPTTTTAPQGDEQRQGGQLGARQDSQSSRAPAERGHAHPPTQNARPVPESSTAFGFVHDQSPAVQYTFPPPLVLSTGPSKRPPVSISAVVSKSERSEQRRDLPRSVKPKSASSSSRIASNSPRLSFDSRPPSDTRPAISSSSSNARPLVRARQVPPRAPAPPGSAQSISAAPLHGVSNLNIGTSTSTARPPTPAGRVSSSRDAIIPVVKLEHSRPASSYKEEYHETPPLPIPLPSPPLPRTRAPSPRSASTSKHPSSLAVMPYQFGFTSGSLVVKRPAPVPPPPLPPPLVLIGDSDGDDIEMVDTLPNSVHTPCPKQTNDRPSTSSVFEAFEAKVEAHVSEPVAGPSRPARAEDIEVISISSDRSSSESDEDEDEDPIRLVGRRRRRHAVLSPPPSLEYDPPAAAPSPARHSISPTSFLRHLAPLPPRSPPRSGLSHSRLQLEVDEVLPLHKARRDKPRRLVVCYDEDALLCISHHALVERIECRRPRTRSMVHAPRMPASETLDDACVLTLESGAHVIGARADTDALSLIPLDGRRVKKLRCSDAVTSCVTPGKGLSAVCALPHRPHFLATGGYDHSVHLWRVYDHGHDDDDVTFTASAALLKIRHTSLVQSVVALHDTGQKLASASADLSVQLFDLGAERVTSTLRVSNSPYNVHATPMPFTVLLEVGHRELQFELRDYRLVPEKAVSRFGFEADKTQGRYLRGAVGCDHLFASGDSSGAVRIWDLRQYSQPLQTVDAFGPGSKVLQVVWRDEDLYAVSHDHQLAVLAEKR